MVWIVAGLGLLVGAEPACACSCRFLTPQEYYDLADAVFVGTVTEIDRPWNPRSSADPVTIQFDVTSVYKGTVPANVRLQTAISGDSCGYEFSPDGRYLVYAAQNQQGTWTTGLCSGTQRLEQVTALPTQAAQPPAPAVAYPDDRPWLPWALGGVGAVVAVAIVLVVTFRRRGRRRAG